MKRTLVHSPAFIRAAKRFVKKQPNAVTSLRQTLLDLQTDVFAPHLRTHKLKGDLAGCWSSSAGYDLRVVFRFVQHENADAILLLSIGTHDEVY